MTNFTTLTSDRNTAGSLYNWCNDDRFDAATVLTEAQAWIYRKLRVRDMLTYQTGSLSIGDTSITIQNSGLRFRAPYHLMITGATANTGPSEIKKRSLADVRNSFSWTGAPPARSRGRPKFYAIDATTLVLSMAADKEYPFDFAHYAAQAPLAASSVETNFLTEKYPGLLRHACMFKAFEHLRRPDERRYHLEMAVAELQAANTDSDMGMETEEINVEVDGEFE